ncbi:hypothetical protein OKW29_000101 [Paraburkholderia sp. CI3]
MNPRELRRMRRDDGQLVIAAMTPETSLTMPFNQHHFRVYEPTTFREACFEAGFRPRADRTLCRSHAIGGNAHCATRILSRARHVHLVHYVSGVFNVSPGSILS